MAKNQNTFEKLQRERQKKRKADEKRARKRQKKEDVRPLVADDSVVTGQEEAPVD